MTIKFKKFSEEDVPIFYVWAEKPQVKNTWFQEGYEKKEAILEKIEGNGYDYPFLILVDDKPIGYIQCEDLTAFFKANPDCKNKYYFNEPEGTYCIDLFIGEEDYLGKGYGTKIMAQFSNWLLTKPEVKKLVIDPSTSNKKAIRCYEKAGFKRVRTAKDEVDEYYIMEKCKLYSLRRFCVTDAAALYEALKNKKVVKHMASSGITLDDCKKIIDEADEHWEKHRIGSWAVIDNNTNKVIGWAGFKSLSSSEIELLVVLSPSYWGIGKSIAKELINKAKYEYFLKELYILLPETRRSFRFIKKLGFTFCGKTKYSGEPFLKFMMSLNESQETVDIKVATASALQNILKTFTVWHKTKKQFVDYLTKQDKGETIFIIATIANNKVVGYANLFWQSRIKLHLKEKIPEIVDLNVITEYQRKGVATKMIRYLEDMVRQKNIPSIGIAVEPTRDYLPAKQLYYKLGYVDDGKCVLPNGEKVLVLRKSLRRIEC